MSINHFSSEELSFIGDTQFPLLKLEAMEKVKLMLQELGSLMLSEPILPATTKPVNYKISRGESYKKLPYMILDVPQLTSQNLHRAGRIMFWWGKYFMLMYYWDQTIESCNKLLADMRQLKNNYILIGEDIWSNDIEEAQWKECSTITDNDFLALKTQKIIKLAALLPIKDYAFLGDAAVNFYSQINSKL